MTCCVCGESFRPGDAVVVPPDLRYAVHDPGCTFLLPRHALSADDEDQIRAFRVLTTLRSGFARVRFTGTT